MYNRLTLKKLAGKTFLSVRGQAATAMAFCASPNMELPLDNFSDSSHVTLKTYGVCKWNVLRQKMSKVSVLSLIGTSASTLAHTYKFLLLDR